ncbi:D-amino acid dehydrogenase [Pseudoalteromonas luteoviolacea B = ATCC 29581]|nr:D-amino acid dehydrogenase [Pseudoalteromonas luteoviolacea B = ATCC 29581]
MSKEIAVIGAGIVGLCNALQLAKRGHKITLFDMNGIANKCSYGNAGHFATEQVFPLANVNLLPQLPKMLLDPKGALSIRFSYLFKALPWFTRFIWNMRPTRQTMLIEALKPLNNESLAAYKRLLDDEYDVFITTKGSLLTFESSDQTKAKQTLIKYQSQGVNVTLLSQAQVFELEPNLSTTVSHALFFPDVGHSTDPHTLCESLFVKITNLDGKLITEQVESIAQQAGHVLIKTNTAKVYRYDDVVVSAGVWSKKLAEQLGYCVPIEAERGYHAMLTMDNPISRPVASNERQFIITPMDKGLRLAGTVEFAGKDAKENHERAMMLLGHTNELLPSTKDITVSSTWMGCRPSLPDSLPILGVAPNHANVYFAFGHQHLGLTQAAITSELIADLIQKHSPSITLTPYRIDRF